LPYPDRQIPQPFSSLEDTLRASVPTSVIDNTYENFPQGTYDGDIGSAEIRDPNGDGSWLLLKLGLTTVAAAEGTGDPGRSAFTSDITLVTDGVDVRETDFSGKIPFPITRASGLLAGLAEGLGVATRTNGRVDIDLQSVVDALTGGEFSGERVGFQVSHFTNRKDKTYDQYAHFGPAS
jgi:hypothetical protein